MKYANGSATTTSVIVTSAASTTVRQMMRRYVAVKISRKFANVSWWCRSLVNGSTLHNDVSSSTANEAR